MSELELHGGEMAPSQPPRRLSIVGRADVAGYLEKWNRSAGAAMSGRSWQRRWFALEQDTLTYGKGPGSSTKSLEFSHMVSSIAHRAPRGGAHRDAPLSLCRQY
jgi:hypothetical protein